MIKTSCQLEVSKGPDFYIPLTESINYSIPAKEASSRDFPIGLQYKNKYVVSKKKMCQIPFSQLSTSWAAHTLSVPVTWKQFSTPYRPFVLF